MRAEIAGKTIAKFISKDWPSNKEEVFEVLTMAINKAWKEGKWFGMTKELFLPVKKNSKGESYIIAPTDYPILLAVNVEGKSDVDLRSKHFMFHKNGDGDIKNRCGCRWATDVFDMGQIPVLDDSRINVNCPIRVGVRSIGIPGPNEKIFIKGKYDQDQQVFTYKNKELGDSCECLIEEDKIESVNGIELKVSKDFNYISNIKFSEITSIEKTLTRTPVEIIGITPNNSSFLLSRLNPGQTISKYRKYLVPESACGCGYIHGLFKIANQEDITSDSDEVIIDDKEILICLAKSINFLYYKDQPELGSGYFIQAISLLDKLKREQESPEVFPIQIEMINETPNFI